MITEQVSVAVTHVLTITNKLVLDGTISAGFAEFIYGRVAS